MWHRELEICLLYLAQIGKVRTLFIARHIPCTSIHIYITCVSLIHWESSEWPLELQIMFIDIKLSTFCFVALHLILKIQNYKFTQIRIMNEIKW